MEEIRQIIELISKNYKLTERENKLIEYALSYPLNYPRVAKIVEMSIRNKLDKMTVLCFVIYQLIKNHPDQEEKVWENLSKEEKTMVADFKSIQNINQLTASEEVEDIKKLFLVMGKDLRVVMLKLFGVYYDISILNNPLSEEQKRFVMQVKEIHVPLSERLGLDNLKQAMNDNVVRLEYPEEYQRLKIAIESKQEENSKQLEITKSKIEALLKELNIKGEIQSRIKRVSSIFNKLHNKQLSLDQIYDILAMRVIVDSVEE